jgi:hypothetical protein
MAIFGTEGGNTGSGSGGRSSVAALVSAVNATTAGWGSTQDINPTVTGLTFSLPAIGVGDIAPTLKTVSLRHIGTNPVTLALTGGTLSNAIGLIMLPGSIWTFEAQTLTTANVSATNAAQLVVSDVGTAIMPTGVSLLAGNISAATAIALTGLAFTAQETATYLVSLSLHSNQTAATESLTGVLVDTLTPTVAITGSETLVAVPGATGQYSGSNTFSFSAVAGRTYQARAFSTAGVATAAVISNTNGRSTLTWQKNGGSTVSAVAGAVAGDRKFSDLLLDHSNWILLDGRLKTALTTAQQAVATSLGYGVNIPDMRGRMALGIGGTIGATALGQGGSATIAQNQLPNVVLSFSGSTGNAGAHSHTINGNANGATGGSQGTFSTVAASNWAVISSVVDHAHSFSGTTTSLSGGVTQQNYVPSYAAGNWFVWLGASAQTITFGTPTTRCVVTANYGSAQALAGNTTINLTGWTSSKDTTASFNAATGVFTAPRAGDYQINMRSPIQNFVPSGSAAYVGNLIGTIDGRVPVYSGLATGTLIPIISQVFTLTAGQTLQLQAVSAGQSMATAMAATGQFSVHEIDAIY